MTEERDLFEGAKRAAAVLNRMLRESDELIANFEGSSQDYKISEVRPDGPYLVLIGEPRHGRNEVRSEWAGTIHDIKALFTATKAPARNDDLIL